MILPMKNRRVVQNAWVVKDIDAAMKNWVDTMSVGPFLEMQSINPDTYLYRGEDVRPRMRVALAQAGEVQIEFMQILEDRPSIYRDMFAFGDGGFHHVLILTDDFDQDIAHHRALGLDIPVLGSSGDLRVAFVDTRSKLGFMLEIVNDCPLIHAIFGAVRKASEHWDGSDPFRPLVI